MFVMIAKKKTNFLCHTNELEQDSVTQEWIYSARFGGRGGDDETVHTILLKPLLVTGTLVILRVTADIAAAS